MKLIEITAKEQCDLFALLCRRREEIEQARRNQGAFVVTSSPKKGRNQAEIWKHRSHPGRVRLAAGKGGTVHAKIVPKAGTDEDDRIFGAFMAWLDRNCRERILTIAVSYSD